MKDYKWNAVFNPLIEKYKPKTFCEIGCHEGLTLKSLTPLTKELGYKTVPSFFITSSLNYLKCGTDLMAKDWKTPKWRAYWVWILLRRIIRVTRQWEKIPYDFYGSFERGQERINESDAAVI